MGPSKKWLKAIVRLKLSPSSKTANTEVTPQKKSSRWNLLNSCRVIDNASILGGDDDDDVVNRAPVFSSQAEREEWAATRIQTAFRAFLARRALCALKGLARLQAAINGHNAQKQSIGSLRSIQTFVRMQARIRAHRSLKDKGDHGVPHRITSHTEDSRPAESEDGWCYAIGSVEEVQARAQQKQEASIKRERALAYAFSNQWRANSRLNLESLFDYELNNSTWSWIWLDRWINSQTTEGYPSNAKLKSDEQAGEDMAGKNITLKKSASVGLSKSSNSKPNTPKGNHSQLSRTKSHGAASGLHAGHFSNASKLNGKTQAQKPNGVHVSKQRNWRSWSTPKQRPVKDVKRKNSMPDSAR
ncbi:hypothetical protein L7F22_012988 [Adiantum nelumboides]|nr:hypothetical protein [Adiantum nelumboides]